MNFQGLNLLFLFLEHLSFFILDVLADVLLLFYPLLHHSPLVIKIFIIWVSSSPQKIVRVKAQLVMAVITPSKELTIRCYCHNMVQTCLD